MGLPVEVYVSARHFEGKTACLGGALSSTTAKIMSFQLLLIVFSALWLHLAYGSDGRTARMPLMRYLASNAATRTNGSLPDRGYRSWLMDGSDWNQTRQVKPDSGGVAFATDFQSGTYETQRRRPIQQFFYNIYIQDSPSLRVNNFIRAGENLKKPIPSLVQYGLRNGGGDSLDDGEDVSGAEKQPVSSDTAENAYSECRRNGNKCERAGVVLEADGESMRKMLDAVNSELFRNVNVTTETPVNKAIQFKIVNVSPQIHGQHEVGERENADGDVPIGNLWRAFSPKSQDNAGGMTGQQQSGYPMVIGRSLPGNVMQIPHSTPTLNISNHPGVANPEPVTPADKSYPYPNSNPANFPRQKEYPAYGRHSYHEIMRKFLDPKKDLGNDSLEQRSGEFKTAENTKDIVKKGKRLVSKR